MLTNPAPVYGVVKDRPVSRRQWEIPAVTGVYFVLQSLWDWLFFWQKVPDHIPIEPPRFRLINPHVIRETALDLLKYAPPRLRLWGWDQVMNIFQTKIKNAFVYFITQQIWIEWITFV